MADRGPGEAEASPRPPRLRRVLLLCSANTARSVMAEHLMRRELRARGIDGQIAVRSAGIADYARDGALVSLDTRLALRAVGIEIGEDARSTNLKLHPELLEEADLVITMTASQSRELLEKFPQARARPVETIRALAGEPGDIDDPFENPERFFGACCEKLSRLMPQVVDRLLAA